MAAGIRATVAAVAMAALVVGAAGCSSSSGGDTPSTTAQPTSTPSQVARNDQLATERAACQSEVASLKVAVEAYKAASPELRYPNSTAELMAEQLLDDPPTYHDITTGGQIVVNAAGKAIDC